jgi:hypothetical protein
MDTFLTDLHVLSSHPTYATRLSLCMDGYVDVCLAILWAVGRILFILDIQEFIRYRSVPPWIRTFQLRKEETVKRAQNTK